MYRSIMFFILTFFISTGFINNSNVAKKEIDRQEKFLDFLSHFEKVSLPYSLDLNKMECTTYSKKVKNSSGKFSKMMDKKFFQKAMEFLPPLSVRFSRIGRPIIQPMARFFPDDETVAIVFSSRMQFSEPMIQEYTLAYYDLKGNLLGNTLKKNIENNSQRIGFTNIHRCQTFTILPSGKIQTTIYENDWASKIGSMPLEQNELLGFKKVNEVTYELAGHHGIKEIGMVNTQP